jgi:hypothetical protein
MTQMSQAQNMTLAVIVAMMTMMFTLQTFPQLALAQLTIPRVF